MASHDNSYDSSVMPEESVFDHFDFDDDVDEIDRGEVADLIIGETKQLYTERGPHVVGK